MKKILVALFTLICAMSLFGSVAVMADAATVELVPTQVDYNSDWDAYMVNFNGTTQNPNENNVLQNNEYAMGKIRYILADGTECVVTNIYTFGTNLGAFITRDGSNRIGVPQKGDILIVSKDCGLLENERTAKEYKFVFDGSRFQLEIELPSEDECSALSIEAAYHNPAWAVPGGQALQVSFGSSTAGLGTYASAITGTQYIEYIDTFGQKQPIADFISVGEGNMILRIGTDLQNLIDKIRVGDKVTFRKGLRLNANEMLKEDVTYVVAQVGSTDATALQPFVSDPTSFELTYTGEGVFSVGTTYAIEWTLEPQGAYATPRFESKNPDIATVDDTGLVTFVKEGKASIEVVVAGKLVKTAEFNVTEAVDVDTVEHTMYRVWVQKGSQITYPNDWKFNVVYKNGSKGPVFDLKEGENLTVDTSALNTNEEGEYDLPAKITYDGVGYDVQVQVTVYQPMDLIVKELAIVDWYSFATFVQYPDSSMNNGNITNGTERNLQNVLDKVEYVRANGEKIELGYYFLAGGNLCLMPRFSDSNITIDNYNKAPYYQEGDVITLKAGLSFYRWTGELAPTASDANALKEGTGMCIVEAVCKEDMAYRFDGNIWGFFKEYTDLTVKQTEISMQFGEKKDAGAERVPSNATSGTITYAVADESVVKVNSRGSIEAIGIGTTTITVKLSGGAAGEVVKTITVTVTDGIKGIKITPEKITVKTQEEILKKLSAVTVWASGKEGTSVDLSNAKIVGFDPNNTTDEQTVTVTVTVDGAELSGTVIVKVNGGGCKGSIGAVSGAAFVLITALACVMICKKKA